jgi:SAM-dependent methyltransferase
VLMAGGISKVFDKGKCRQIVLDLGRFTESVIGDLCMNVNTRGAVHFGTQRGIYGDGCQFETCAHSAISKTIDLVKPTPYDVVYVLGCGKGRAVCHFAQRRVRKVIGIEISKRLCEIALGNARTLCFSKSPIEIRNRDVATADISDGTVFFMFNPFGEKTLRQVLRNIINSSQCGNPIRFIYINPVFSEVFDEFQGFEVVYDYRRHRGQRVVIHRYGKIHV